MTGKSTDSVRVVRPFMDSTAPLQATHAHVTAPRQPTIAVALSLPSLLVVRHRPSLHYQQCCSPGVAQCIIFIVLPGPKVGSLCQ